MIMHVRHTKILNILHKKKKVTVTELSEAIGVSEVTIRKDLSQLEKNGLLSREHGYATMISSDDVSNRLSFNYEVKRRIAQKAVENIKDGETIMIESGSCCALLAEEVVTQRRDITIITNSVFIASFIRHKPGAHVILLGGEFQNEAQVMVGPLIKKCVKNFYVNKFYMGTDGFNETGAMAGDLMRAEAVRDMIDSSKESIILTESEKFQQIGVVPLLPYEKINAIYTDNRIDSSTRHSLEKKNVRICVSTAYS